MNQFVYEDLMQQSQSNYSMFVIFFKSNLTTLGLVSFSSCLGSVLVGASFAGAVSLEAVSALIATTGTVSALATTTGAVTVAL